MLAGGGWHHLVMLLEDLVKPLQRTNEGNGCKKLLAITSKHWLRHMLAAMSDQVRCSLYHVVEVDKFL